MSSDDLPKAVVNRIIKASLPEGVQLTKGTRETVTQAARIFIHHMTEVANETCKAGKRSTIKEQDVETMLTQINLEEFWEEMNESLQVWKDAQAAKKAKRAADTEAEADLTDE